VSTTNTLSTIFNKKFCFNDKVGGLDHVFDKIFGDVLISRIYPQNFVIRTGITRSRRVIIHRPSGTGKTLIARTLCDILKVEPKIVSGPEIYSFMVGESEAKIRALFDDAHEDQQRFGHASRLHVVIFDEIDIICKKRSVSNVSARDNVQESVTTQLLTEIDGMNYLDNILIIGTTNRIDAIDPALFRPGRLEILIDVPLPDEKARLSIFEIHTKMLLKNGLLHHDVNINRIIRGTDGLTGAHIEQIVRRAVNGAMRRDIMTRGTLDISEEEADQLCVCNKDFLRALFDIRSDVEKANRLNISDVFK
jgi:vesicle-fusing ATPase